MTITTLNGVVNALGNSAVVWPINKASLANVVAGQIFSLWQSAGIPGAGATPTTAAVPTNATVGAFTFTNPGAGISTHLGRCQAVSSNSGTDVLFHDRLLHMGGLSGIVTTAQTVGLDASVSTSNMVLRKGAADYSEVQWWIEVYTALGATGVNATAAVTYDDNTSGNVVVALGATPRAGRMYPIVPAVAGRNIKSIQTITLSATTGTAGNFGVTATSSSGGISLPLANYGGIFDWAQLGLPHVQDSACLFMIVSPSVTTTGTLFGTLKIIQG